MRSSDGLSYEHNLVVTINEYPEMDGLSRIQAIKDTADGYSIAQRLQVVLWRRESVI